MLLRAAIVPPQEVLDEVGAVARALALVPGVTAVPHSDLDIHVTGFGNLTPPDAVRLAESLASALEGAEAPVVRFAGLVVSGTTEIALQLAGDVEPLADLARFVSEAAEGLNIYVDRRRYRPALPIVSVADDVSAPMLQSAVRHQQSWTGQDWPVPGLALLRTAWVKGSAEPQAFDLIRLTPPPGFAVVE